MKTLKYRLLVFIISIFVVGCNDIPRIRKDVTYPDLISPIYYIDTFQIKSPRIALVNSIPYIFSLEKLEEFENKEEFIEQKGVIRYLTSDMHSNRYSGYLDVYETLMTDNSFSDLAYRNEFDFGFGLEELFLQDENIKDIPVYKFAFKTETFLLTIISTKYHKEMEISPIDEDKDGCYSYPAVFLKDYMLAIVPVYSKRDLKKINKLYYRSINGKDPDWTYYLPNWVYNLIF